MATKLEVLKTLSDNIQSMTNAVSLGITIFNSALALAMKIKERVESDPKEFWTKEEIKEAGTLAIKEIKERQTRIQDSPMIEDSIDNEDEDEITGPSDYPSANELDEDE